MNMKKVVYILAIVILLLVFAVSAFMVGRYIMQSKEQKEQANALADLKNSMQETRPAETEAESIPEETLPEATYRDEYVRDENGMLKEYGEIYAKNNDLVGWIRIDGTKVDYPVMQTPDNPNYYLKHDFYHNYSDWGAIYAREECDINLPSDNITLYGHNMRDGSMFAVVHKYVDKAVWEQNPLIFFDTLYEYHTYEIFSVFKTTATVGEGFKYHNMIDAESKEDFDEFIATCKELAFYDTGITPEYGDKIICLSTCEYTLEHGRLVMVARRIS